jgi:hypothetical protein
MADAFFEWTYTSETSPDEDKIWRHDILPKLSKYSTNVRDICYYGLTEMLNNAFSHSASKNFIIKLSINDREIIFEIIDSGVGVFAKIQNELGLDDPRHSVLELAKGKFTSDPQNHSGEGIFFTSRIFDQFSIKSGKLLFFGGRSGDWHLEESPESETTGTVIRMALRKELSLKIAEVFNEYTDPDKNPGFHKTIIPLKLMEQDGYSLISRSQAKRLINRFDRFLEVIIDFSGIDMIGQGFADELFRVFANAHSGVKLQPVNCSQNVENMIRHIGFSGTVSK